MAHRGQVYDIIRFPFTRSWAPWKAKAACKGLDVSLFFPKEYQSLKAKEARAICATCPVIIECRRFALDTHSDVGIFGGLSPSERVKWSLGYEA